MERRREDLGLEIELLELRFGSGRWESQGLSETAGEEKHPLQDNLSDPSRNQGGRRPGGVCAGGLGAAPTSAISLCREWARLGTCPEVYGWNARRPKTHVRGATPGELTTESSRGLYKD